MPQQLQFQFTEEEDYPVDMFYDLERVAWLDEIMPYCNRELLRNGKPEIGQHDYNTIRDTLCTIENPVFPLPNPLAPNRDYLPETVQWLYNEVETFRLNL